MDIGPTELIIILIIVVLVFGVGRVGKLGGELGNAIREFRQGLTSDKDQPAGASGKTAEVSSAPASEPAPEAKQTEAPKG
jgi:sec-independent protein translocase protein TatA